MAAEALQQVFARFGVKFDTKQLQQGQSMIQRTMTSLQGFGQALAGALIVRQVAGFVNNTREIGDELDKTAQQIGFTTAELQAFRHAANLSGVGAQESANAIGQLQRRAYDAATAGGRTAETFERLGLELQNEQGELKSGSELFRDLAESMSNMDNPSERVAVSMELMGRQGRKLLPLLTSGAEGLDAMQQEAIDLGGGMSEGAVSASVELTDSMARFQLTMEGVRSRLAVAFLPIIDKVTVGLTKFNAWFLRVSEGSHVFELALITLGIIGVAAAIKLAIAWGAALAPFLLAALAIGVLILVFDDLWVTIQGGDSVLQAFIDEMFGIGTTQRVLRDLDTAWKALIQDIGDAYDGLMDFLEALGIVDEHEGRREREQRQRNETIQRRARQRSQERQARIADAGGVEQILQRERRRLARENLGIGGTSRLTDQQRHDVEQRTGSITLTQEQRRAAIQRVAIPQQNTVNQQNQTTLNIDARGSSRSERAEIERNVRRIIRDENERNNRQTQTALEAQEGEA